MHLHGTTLSVSRFGLGTHALHRLLSGAARRRQLALAYDMGLKYFDTAPSYGAGLAEAELGRFARGRRSELVLTTKFGIAPGRLAALPGGRYAALAARVAARLVGARRPAAPPARDYSALEVRTSVERSLRALATDYVDVLYLHEPILELLGDAAALIRTLEVLKAEGKICHVGLSGNGGECARIAAAHPALAQVLQIEIGRDPQESPVPARPPLVPAVRFWEFSAQDRASHSAERVKQLASRLQAAAPMGTVLMLSTQLEAQLRATVTALEKTALVPDFRDAHPRLDGTE
jgi:hypothetical protein